MDPACMWDLSPMYENDEAWEKDLLTVDDLAKKAAAFAGKLSDAVSIAGFFAASTALERKVRNLFCYANLRKSEDNRADAAQSMFARIYGKFTQVLQMTAFAEPEILSLPEEAIRAAAEDPALAEYRFLMEQLIDRKPHTLSAEAEMLLAGFGEVFAVPGQVAENLMDADMSFHPAKNAAGEKVELTESSFILLQHSEDRALRESAFRSYYRSYCGHINTFAAAYNGQVRCAASMAQARHFGSSREMEMAEEHVPVEVYDNLVATVRRFLPEMHRYAALRKKMLGVDELHYYDLYAPLCAGSSRHFTYEEAQEMVLSAVKPLGKEYGDTVRRAFRDRWIDVYPNKGKTGGAFSAGTYDSAPYILANFTGTLDSVSMIAHEMGHSMHTWHANTHQPPQYAGYTLFVAEVASTVNENLLVEQLLGTTKDPKERMAYLNQYLEGFKGTVFRQTMFAEFEMKAHAMAERGEALTPAVLNGIYKELIADYFGPALTLDDEVAYEWARIPHFYHPFYVYKYATSYCAAVAVSEAVLAEAAGGEKGSVQRFLEFLSMGGSDHPLKELSHAGVDLSGPAPIERALEKFGRILDEAEKVSDELAALR